MITAFVVVICCTIFATAQSMHGAFLPPPPGTTAQNNTVYLNGERTNGQWRALASKKLVGSANGTQFYQWYLSIYAMQRGAYRLRYRSPGNGGPLSQVTQANGMRMWFPVQALRIVGGAELARPGVQQLVVQSHEVGADCGSATVTVFAAGAGGSIAPAISISNPCELTATIAGDRHSIVLRGPYYAANAPMCCPTKPHADAVLRFHSGAWMEVPNYYKLDPKRFSPT